ncbi:MAG: efflux RND transporter periplasmic adaptor subunit [Alphaproteobacteria bacterium]
MTTPAPRHSPLLLLATALATACGSGHGAKPEEAAALRATPTPAPVAVTAIVADKRRVERTIDFVGTLNANAEASVAAEIDGRLTAIRADLGDMVARGQVLATLDSSEIEARLREAEASLVRRTNDAKRAEQLRTRGVMSQQEYDAITSDLGVARARRDLLAIQVANTRIKAPFDGRIAKRKAEVGDYVRTGTPIFVLVSDDPLKLRGEVPERFATEIAVGQEVRATVEALPGETLLGKLARISPASNTTSRALTVEALVPNPGGRLKTGFFAKADILTRADAEAIVVPVEALVSFAGVTRVFVIEPDGTVKSREVAPGLRRGAGVEITRGLEPGDRVATSGLGRLSEGTPVVVRAPEAVEAPAAAGGATGDAGGAPAAPAPAAAVPSDARNEEDRPS